MSNTGPSRMCGLAALVLLSALSLFSAQPDLKLPLHIVYVGRPGAERTGDFVSFLKEHFKRVDSADLKGVQLGRVEADVILLDYDGDGFKAPRFTFPKDYSQPTVTIGVAGALIGSQNRLKTGYL